MNRDHVLMAVKSKLWAMRPESLSAIYQFLETGAALDSELFHADTAKVSAFLGDEIQGTSYSYRKGEAGIMMIDGPIIPRATMFSDVSGVMSIDMMTDDFKRMEADPRIARILIMADSPGGDVVGVSDFAALIKASSKPVSVFAWCAASAMYWIAASADEIISPVSGMVGSIGVVTAFMDDSAKQEKSGVKVVEMVSSQSPLKRATPDSDEGRGTIQQMLDDIADAFVTSVADGRKTTADNVLAGFGQGAMYVAARAMEAGMIDGIEDMETFISNRSKSGLMNINKGEARKGLKMEDEKKIESADGQELATPVNAAKQERERIQSIESLSADFDGGHPFVFSAVKSALDALKYDEGMTKEKAAVALIAIVAKSQNELLAKMEASAVDAKTAAVAASQASSEAVKTEKKDDRAEANVSALKKEYEKEVKK